MLNGILIYNSVLGHVCKVTIQYLIKRKEVVNTINLKPTHAWGMSMKVFLISKSKIISIIVNDFNFRPDEQQIAIIGNTLKQHTV